MASILGDQDRAQELHEESLALSQALRDQEGLALYRETGNKSGIAYCLDLSAQVALSQGEVATARRLAEESVALQRETGEQLGMMNSLSLLGEVEANQGNYETARSLYEESLAIARKTG